MHAGGSNAGLFGNCFLLALVIDLLKKEPLISREEHVPRRRSYSVLRNCHQEARGLGVSYSIIFLFL